jgi:hypothetical protein
MMIIITHENFSDICETLIIGMASAANYNRSCFGMSDLKLMSRTEQVVSELIQKTKESGYDPFSLIRPVLQKYGYSYFPEPDETLKQSIDEFLLIRADIGEQLYEYCRSVYEDSKTNHAPFTQQPVLICASCQQEIGEWGTYILRENEPVCVTCADKVDGKHTPSKLKEVKMLINERKQEMAQDCKMVIELLNNNEVEEAYLLLKKYKRSKQQSGKQKRI